MLFPSRSVSWLVVFLGNPGLRYEGTRHNAGFMTADALARKKNISINRSRFQALTASCPIGDTTVLLMKPQTYMNLSGEAVGQAARFYKIPADHVLVVSDDITLPIGAMRIRAKGSAGARYGGVSPHPPRGRHPAASRLRHDRLGAVGVPRPGRRRHGRSGFPCGRRGGVLHRPGPRKGHEPLQPEKDPARSIISSRTPVY